MNNMESKGLVLYIWKKPQYGFMAYHLAMSVKHYSPSIPIHLITDDLAVSRLKDLSMFDTIEYVDTPTDPAQAKIDMYHMLPFDHNVFLDADGLCLTELDTTLDGFIESDKPFQCYVHAYYNKHDKPDLPLMVWARRDVIWDHYGFDLETLPATQSSMLYIRKGEFCDELYRRMQLNYKNPIPLESLSNKWGGGQPDELYLNVTLAQMGYDPKCENIIYFADDRTLKPRQIKDHYKILSLFGTAQNVKPILERYYDGEVQRIANGRITYEWKNIKNAKHANVAQVVNRRSAFKGKFVRSEKINDTVTKKGRTLLFSSYFQSGDPSRDSELRTCLNRNLSGDTFDHVYLYSESEVPSNHKLTVRYQGRPTYQNLIDWANDVSHDGDVVVIANSDIYFDNTLNWSHNVPMEMTCIALSRWDVAPNGSKKLFAYEHSQDSWIFKGKINIKGANYYMGIPGCDNRIAFDADQSGYRVVNTAKDIITYHLHNSNIRSYTQKDRLEGGYLPVWITSIRDLKSNKLLIQQPGKVGDIICCLPIAEYFSNRGYEVEWECPQAYHSLFDYVDYVKPVITSTGGYSRVIDLSFGLNRQSPTNIVWQKRRKEGSLDSFVTLKYELAGVPISRCRLLTYNRNEANEATLMDVLGIDHDSSYNLVHSNSDYGTRIDVDTGTRCIEFSPVGGFTIFDWRKVIEGATEIHCIDSSLANFVDCLDVDAKLFYYKTDRVPLKADQTILTKNWTIINMMEYANS